MTHIFILVDPDTITMKKSDLRPKEVMKQIYEGEFRLPEEMESPRCLNLDDYVFVVGRKPMPNISDIQEEILEKLALGNPWDTRMRTSDIMSMSSKRNSMWKPGRNWP